MSRVTDHLRVPLRTDAQSVALSILRAKEAIKPGGAMRFRLQAAEALFVRRLRDDDTVVPPLWTQLLSQLGIGIELKDDGFHVYNQKGEVMRYDDDPYRSGLRYYLRDIPVPVSIEVTGQEYPNHLMYEDGLPQDLVDMVSNCGIEAPAHYQAYLVEKRAEGTYGNGAEKLYGSATIKPLSFDKYNGGQLKISTKCTNANTSIYVMNAFKKAHIHNCTVEEFSVRLDEWKAPSRIKQKLLESPEYCVHVSSETKKEIKSGHWSRIRDVPVGKQTEFLVHMLRKALEDEALRRKDNAIRKADRHPPDKGFWPSPQCGHRK